MQNNKRQAERISTSQPISIYHDEINEPGKMIDISIQGSGFIANNKVGEGQDICIKFSLPAFDSRAEIELKGVVVHSYKIRDQYLVGLEFTKISPSYQIAIQEFIQRHHGMND